jgi:predicted dehydrogenase
MDLGCYALHVQRVFAGGEPRVVSATGAERAGRPGVDERITAALEFPGGASGEAHCDMAAVDWSITCRVTGDRGEAVAMNFVLPQRDDRVMVTTSDGQSTEHLGTRSTYRYQLEAVREHLRGGTPFPLDADDAVATAELIDATYLAAGFEPRPRSAR